MLNQLTQRMLKSALWAMDSSWFMPVFYACGAIVVMLLTRVASWPYGLIAAAEFGYLIGALFWSLLQKRQNRLTMEAAKKAYVEHSAELMFKAHMQAVERIRQEYPDLEFRGGIDTDGGGFMEITPKNKSKAH